MTRIALLAGSLLLAACGGESAESADTGAAVAPGADVGATGSDATAVPVAGDTSATNAAHP